VEIATARSFILNRGIVADTPLEPWRSGMHCIPSFVTHFLSISVYEFAWTGFILGANTKTKNVVFCFFSVFYIALERVNLITK